MIIKNKEMVMKGYEEKQEAMLISLYIKRATLISAREKL